MYVLVGMRPGGLFNCQISLGPRVAAGRPHCGGQTGGRQAGEAGGIRVLARKVGRQVEIKLCR